MNMNPVSIIQQVAGHPVGVPPQLLSPPEIDSMDLKAAPPQTDSLPEEHEDAVTLPSGSDSYPGTIVARPNDKTIVVRKDTATQTSGDPHTETQTYDYFPNLNEPERIFTLRKNDRWVLKGEKLDSHIVAHLGYRRAYRDPSF